MFLKELIHPEDTERSAKYLKKLEEEGYYSDYEGRIVTRDGEIRYVEVNSTAIYENGKFVGSRDMVRDITSRKQVEMALRKAKRDAEQARLAEQHRCRASDTGRQGRRRWARSGALGSPS